MICSLHFSARHFVVQLNVVIIWKHKKNIACQLGAGCNVVAHHPKANLLPLYFTYIILIPLQSI